MTIGELAKNGWERNEGFFDKLLCFFSLIFFFITRSFSCGLFNRQLVLMEHVSSYLDLPLSQMEIKMVGPVQNSSGSQYFSVSNEQMNMVEPVSSNSVSEPLMVPSSLGDHNGSLGGSTCMSPMLLPNKLGSTDENMGSAENSSSPVKRKAESGPFSPNSVSRPSLFPSKRPAHAGLSGNSSGYHQSSATERKTTSVQPELDTPGIQSQFPMNKKMVRNDSMAGRSAVQPGQNAKKQTARIISTSKTQSGSSEAVRSKMRESLAAALELAFKNPDSAPNSIDKTNATASQLTPVDSKASESNSSVSDLGSGSGVLASEKPAVADKANDTQLLSADFIGNGSSVNGGKIFEEFQFGSFLPDEDVPFGDNFFAKDDLLQGNGLSWAFEFDTQMKEAKHTQDAENVQPVKQEDHGQADKIEQVRLVPNDVAVEIEAGLFKLFGGVNKKYKEKGRSLLYNLKDNSNPELRERVMSGAISPERLCSMSAEELASKELSEWRIAKAEAYAQMVVLPDTEVDVRRLVKKTHKGEYQVMEVERDDGIISEISGGASMVTRHPPIKGTQGHPSPKVSTRDKTNTGGQDSGLGNQDVSGSLIIPTDGTDVMQGIIVDEMKDPALLPPIVSLDEFMESLNAEPPFGNISPAAEVKNLSSYKESPKTTNSHASDSPKYAPTMKADADKSEVGLLMKATGVSAKPKVIPSSPKVEYFWQGKLQLNIGSSVTAGSLFQSGEKTSTKDWSTSLEIKGKVRIEAFEKFLQDLPMSRTRAVMVLLFVLKDKSSEDELSNLSEAVNSYIEEQRLGFAEPATGVELYMCPPTTRMIDMLKKHLPKHTLPNDSTKNELIGVVVWRRAQTSNAISPNSSSHHKHSSKKQPFAPKRVQDTPKHNANAPNRATSLVKPQPEPEEDDDIPPGFGPVAAARAAKDDDDLPEFNFSGHVSRPVSQSNGVNPQRPVDQVRELIKKYGQSDTNTPPGRNPVNNSTLKIRPWDDEDDDIPEWRPDAPPQHLLNPRMYNHGLNLPVPLHPGVPPSPQPPQTGGRWALPPGGPRWRPY